MPDRLDRVTVATSYHLYAAVCERGLEGVVAKPLRSLYRPGKRGWVKVKNKTYWRRESELAGDAVPPRPLAARFGLDGGGGGVGGVDEAVVVVVGGVPVVDRAGGQLELECAAAEGSLGRAGDLDLPPGRGGGAGLGEEVEVREGGSVLGLFADLAVDGRVCRLAAADGAVELDRAAGAVVARGRIDGEVNTSGGGGEGTVKFGRVDGAFRYHVYFRQDTGALIGYVDCGTQQWRGNVEINFNEPEPAETIDNVDDLLAQLL